jgi:hypothetical protein
MWEADEQQTRSLTESMGGITAAATDTMSGHSSTQDSSS